MTAAHEGRRSPKSLEELFDAPPAEYGPVPIWWWSGDALTAERLCWQLDRLAEGGVRNVVVLNLAPAGPQWGAATDDPRFLSEAWWALFAAVCDHASAIGTRVWFYDQLGFSGAGLQAKIAARRPELLGWHFDGTSVAEGVGRLQVDSPAEGEPFAAFATPLAGGLPERVSCEGRSATFDAGDVPTRLRLVQVVRRAYDYLHPDAATELLEVVHRAFERRLPHHLGSTIVGSFQDELPALPPWTADFADRFLERHGYDIAERIGWLFDGTGDEVDRVRLDYQRTRAELGEQRLFRPMFDWHEAHGIICGTDQSNGARAGDPIDCVGFYADYFRTNRWYGAPGSDHGGDATIHASIAHLYDRPRTWIESFHSSGWGGTLEETYAWLLPWLRAGATLYDPHAVYASTRGGWWEWASPSTCWRQPYWRHHELFATTVARLCAVLAQGHHVCDVAVLHPTTTVMADLPLAGPVGERATRAQDVYRQLLGHRYWVLGPPGVLDAARLDADVIDEASLQRAALSGGVVAVADETYRAVVLPACAVLEAETVTALAAFAAAGGTVVSVGEPPAGVRAVVVDSATEVIAALDLVAPRCEGDRPTLHRRIGDRDVVLVTAADATGMVAGGQGSTVFEFDRSLLVDAATVRVVGLADRPDPMVWDPVTGERRPPRAVARDGDDVVVEVSLGGRPAVLLVWGGDGVSTAESAPAPVSQELWVGPEVWDVEVVASGDNTYGDLALPASPGPLPVATWRFDDGAGQEVVATFGPKVEVAGPFEPGTATAEPSDGDWRVVGWSSSRGIRSDSLHRITLGAKGVVPEEVIDLGEHPTGSEWRIRTWLHVADEPCHLVVGGVVAVRAWIDGGDAGWGGDGYHAAFPMPGEPGLHRVELHVVADESFADVPFSNNRRLSLALVRDLPAYARPAWLGSPDQGGVGSVVRFRTEVVLDDAPVSAELSLGTHAVSRLIVNGALLVEQGSHVPYLPVFPWAQPYPVDLQVGTNLVEVEVVDSGKPITVMIDGEARMADGTTVAFTTSGADVVSRDGGGWTPARVVRRHFGFDPAFALLRPRPHPLPRSTWLSGDAEATSAAVVDAAFDPLGDTTSVEVSEWTIPPGAVQATVPLAVPGRLSVDGVEVPIVDGVAELPGATEVGRRARLVAEGRPGHRGGAVLDGPVTYRTTVGRSPLAPWSAMGLADFSGAVRYSTVLLWSPGHVTGGQRSKERHVLDIGDIRGTAEVTVNGVACGARFCGPWRFEVGHAMRPGENRVEILVTSTLAPSLAATSPTPYAPPEQCRHGLFGPVKLLRPES